MEMIRSGSLPEKSAMMEPRNTPTKIAMPSAAPIKASVPGRRWPMRSATGMP